jgi:hypothetical protein
MDCDNSKWQWALGPGSKRCTSRDFKVGDHASSIRMGDHSEVEHEIVGLEL